MNKREVSIRMNTREIKTQTGWSSVERDARWEKCEGIMKYTETEKGKINKLSKERIPEMG